MRVVNRLDLLVLGLVRVKGFAHLALVIRRLLQVPQRAGRLLVQVPGEHGWVVLVLLDLVDAALGAVPSPPKAIHCRVLTDHLQAVLCEAVHVLAHPECRVRKDARVVGSLPTATPLGSWKARSPRQPYMTCLLLTV